MDYLPFIIAHLYDLLTMSSMRETHIPDGLDSL